MRLLHVVPTYIPAYRYGGPIYSVHGLCRALSARGHDVHVFTTNVDGPDNSPVPMCRPVLVEGVRVWYFPSRHSRRLYWSPSMGRMLRARVRGFDLVHLHSIFLWPTWAAARASRKYKVPYVVSPRGMLVKNLIRRKSRIPKTAWISLIERRNLEKASALHMTSAIEELEAKRFGFKLPVVKVIPNGVDMPAESPAKNKLSVPVRDVLNRKPMILFIGRINWKKGIDRLISAMRQIETGRLVVAGNDEEGYTAYLERVAEMAGVTQRVSFVGPVYGSDKIALLNFASVFALPSISENFGNAAMEAMAAGCPVVVSAETGIADIVRESGGGVVFDGDTLGRTLSELLPHPNRLKRMGEAAKRFVFERCSWDAVAERMESFYKSQL